MEIYRNFPKKTLRNRLCDIYNLIQNPKYKEINSSYDIEQSYIESLFTQAIERYQKNRANKISIELSSRLFNIHYLEGLIKMTNTLSKNSDVSLDRISNTIDIMLNSYQKQMAGNQLSGVEISQIEKKELESNPYWKMMQELKELIKSRKDDK